MFKVIIYIHQVSYQLNTLLRYFLGNISTKIFLTIVFHKLVTFYRGWNIKNKGNSLLYPPSNKGPYTYYTITLGGVGGQGTSDDIDGALRGGGGV